MCGFSADGKSLKPYLVFAYERIPKIFKETFPHDRAVLQASKKGWMDSERCVLYLEEVAKEVTQRGIQLPEEKILLFWDRHSSHMTLEVCQTAERLGIILVGLYPNATFLIQPCDVAIFRSLKTHWTETMREEKSNDLEKTVTKQEFPHLFLRAFDKIQAKTVTAGFKATGIFPWDHKSIDFTKCIGKKRTNAIQSEELVEIDQRMEEALSMRKRLAICKH